MSEHDTELRSSQVRESRRRFMIGPRYGQITTIVVQQQAWAPTALGHPAEPRVSTNSRWTALFPVMRLIQPVCLCLMSPGLVATIPGGSSRKNGSFTSAVGPDVLRESSPAILRRSGISNLKSWTPLDDRRFAESPCVGLHGSAGSIG